jgi:hypothetical protein
MPVPVSATDTTTNSPSAEVARAAGVSVARVRRSDRDLAATRHRIATVNREVQDDELKLRNVNHGWPQSRI